MDSSQIKKELSSLSGLSSLSTLSDQSGKVTLGVAYRYATELLKKYKIDTPASDSGVILCHLLNCDRAYLFSHSERILTSEELQVLSDMLAKRLEGMPVQYIIGHREFMSLDFMVTPAVMVPRHETELLVEKVIAYVKSRELKTNDIINILDIGTGSGCIAVSLARYLPLVYVTATDISEDALAVAENNAQKHGVSDRIKFLCGSLFEALNNDRNVDCEHLQGISTSRFNVIVSNPPYIETDLIKELFNEVKDYEPVIALDGGKDGLSFYRAIIEKAPEYLSDNGLLAFETGYCQAAEVAGILQKTVGFNNIEIIKDLQGIERVVTGIFRKPL